MEQFKEMSVDTIAAVSTPNGVGGIAVIRVSGPQALSIVGSAWRGKSFSEALTHTAHLGKYYNVGGELVDECVATVFRSPGTFTGEDIVELSVHGSRWIQREVLTDLVRRGARIAEPGEFTKRAFLNGRLDLAQAEGIADLIASSSRAAHRLAVSQTRGNFSKALDSLRERLIEFASLLELELDFSEEEVEFADRQQLLQLSTQILKEVRRLSGSYSTGSVIKEGVPVVIAGVPNAGKSSLLNMIVNEEKAIVSDIPGTTRDTIEDTVEIDGILYRFVDTAGLRESEDVVESIGITKARERMRKAHIVIWLLDPTISLEPQYEELRRFTEENPDSRLILLSNKSDLLAGDTAEAATSFAGHSNNFVASTTSPSSSSSSEAATSLSSSSTSTSDIPSTSTKANTPYTTSPETALSFPRSASVTDPTFTTSPETALSLTSTSPETALSLTSTTSETDASLHSSPETALSLLRSASEVDASHPYSGDLDFLLSKSIRFSTKTGEGLQELMNRLKEETNRDYNPDTEIMVTNARHYESLIKGGEAIERAIAGIETGLSGDFIAQDVREAIHHLGTITGSITTTTLLHSIFSRFCIGK